MFEEDRLPSVVGHLESPTELADTSPPGPQLAAALAGMRPADLSDDALLEVIQDWDRHRAWTDAQQNSAIAEFARRRGRSGQCLSEFAIDELAAGLRLSRTTAGNRMHVAVDLDQRLPGTAAALGRGEIDQAKARAVVEATTGLDAPVAAAVEARVLPRAPQQTVGQLRASLARAVPATDPAGAAERHERAVADRRVILTPQPDGMAELWALLPADAATAVYAAIDTYARGQRDADPSGAQLGMDARRADALVALVTGVATAPMRPLVHLTVAATTLLDLDDQPGDLAGYGPVPATVARRVAADPTGTWRRILTDPATGDALDIGTKTYRPPTATARQVRIRDGRCRFPGCRQPAHRCDLDHVRPWPAGPTSAENLIVLCRHHHRLKHAGHWQITATPAGTVTWTAPTGHTYTTHPQPAHAGPTHAGPTHSNPADSEPPTTRLAS